MTHRKLRQTSLQCYIIEFSNLLLRVDQEPSSMLPAFPAETPGLRIPHDAWYTT